jgi:hypothetical protein
MDTTSQPDELPDMSEVMGLLREADVLTEAPRGLLAAGAGGASRLALIQEHVASHPESAEELAYLANALTAGCSIQGRPFAAVEAPNAAAAVCNLGLEAWPAHWSAPSLVAAFQLGWTILHRDVAMCAAERLIAVIGELPCRDRDIQLRLHGLRRNLQQAVRDGMPCRARNALEALVMLDAPCWAVLVALTDECPVLHAAISPATDQSRPISPSDFEFISELRQIATVGEFMDSLPRRLSR